MRRHYFVMLCAFLAVIWSSGCSKQDPTGESKAPTPTVAAAPALNVAQASTPQSTPSAVNPWQQGDVLMGDGAQRKYVAALLEAIDLLGQKKYPEALIALQTAAKFKDTEFVQSEIKKLTFRIARQQAADNAVQVIQLLLDEGKSAEAGQLVAAAMAEYASADVGPALVKLKLQTDAILAAQINDNRAKRKGYEDQAKAALDAGNLRAAALALEQAREVADDDALRRQAEEIQAKLTKYDDDRQQAAELRKDPSNLEDAIALLNDAAQQWDTLENRQDLDDYTLALQNRRDRVAIADFEVRGDVGIPNAERVLAEELLPHFKRRFDLVDRGQVAKVMNELKLEAGGLAGSDLDQRQVGRLAKVQYFVAGSITRVGGLVVNARLVDCRTGLIVQTAKIDVPTPDDVLAKLPELAKLLLMTDEERVAYEQELAKLAPAVEAVQPDQALPPAPDVPLADQPVPAPLFAETNRLPDMGGVNPAAFQAFAPIPDGQPLPLIVDGGAAELVWKRKALLVSVSLGDNLFRRGRHRDALRFFDFGLTLGLANAELDVRLARVRPQVTPIVIVNTPPPRIAVIDFAVSGDPAMVPPALGFWTPQYLAPYFSPSYEVVDRGELYWWMARMGMTVRDLAQDPYARRWLGRALNVRYFVFGAITQTASFNVDTYLVDADFGYLNGRGFVHARDPFELKWRLGELAQLTQTPPDVWILQQQVYRDYEVLIVKAQQAINIGDFVAAIGFLDNAKQLRPRSMELAFYYQRVDVLTKNRTFGEQRRREMERQQVIVVEHKKNEEVLTLRAQEQRLVVTKEIAGLTPEQRKQRDRERDADRLAAQNQLLLQARLSFKGGNVKQSVQIYESALALRQSDEVSRELAAARAELDHVTKQRVAAEAKLRDLKVQQQKEQELEKVRVQLEIERKTRQQDDVALRNAQAERDNAEYLRLVEQGRKQMSGAKYDAAVGSFQAAGLIKKTDQVDGLLNEAKLALAKTGSATKSNPVVEKKAMEAPKDAALEAAKLKKKADYDVALKEGRVMLTAKKYDEAIRALQMAEKYQPGDATAADLLQQAQKARADVQRETAATAEKAKLKAGYEGAVKQGRNLLTAKKYDDAIKAFQLAGSYQPGDVAAANLIQQAQKARADAQHEAIAASSVANKKLAYDEAFRQGHDFMKAQKYAEAVKSFTYASKLMPADPSATSALRDAQLKLVASKTAPGPSAAQKAEYAKQMQAGAAFDKQSKWSDAMKAYSAALNQLPKDSRATESLNKATFRFHMAEGNRLMTVRRFPDAVREFNAAARLYPDDREVAAALKKAKEAK